MATKFTYVPLAPEPISGKSFIKQTEKAFDELGTQIDDSNDLAREALAVSESALATANGALSTATDAVMKAQDALDTAHDALDNAATAEDAAANALTRANGAFDLAAVANSEAQTAQGMAGSAAEAAAAAQNSAQGALEAAEAAGVTAGAAYSEALSIDVYTVTDTDGEDQIDLDKYHNERKYLYLTGSGAAHMPARAGLPAYFSVAINSEDTQAIQTFQEKNSPDRYTRFGAITPGASEGDDPSVSWSNWSALSPPVLAEHVTIFVDAATGNDSNDGFIKPLRTLRAAFKLAQGLDPRSQTVTVNLAAGDYGDVETPYLYKFSNWSLVIVGAGVERTRLDKLVVNGTRVRLDGLACKRLVVQFGGVVQIQGNGALRLSDTTSNHAINIYQDGSFVCPEGTTLEFAGSYNLGIFASGTGGIASATLGGTVTFIDTPVFTTFCLAASGGDINLRETLSYDGSFTGKQWDCSSGGGFNCAGSTMLSAIPGTAPGGPLKPGDSIRAVKPVLSDAMDGTGSAADGVAASEKAVGDLARFLAGLGFNTVVSGKGAVDLNTLVTAGFYGHFQNGSANAPMASPGILIVYAYSATSIKQVWYAASGAASGSAMYSRYSSNGGSTWTDWLQIAGPVSTSLNGNRSYALASESAVGDLNRFFASLGFGPAAAGKGGVDANTLTQGGIYYNNATGSSNFPQPFAGWTFVLRFGTTDSYAKQIWTRNSSAPEAVSNVFMRLYTFSTDTWTDWQQVAGPVSNAIDGIRNYALASESALARVNARILTPIAATKNFYIDPVNGQDTNTGLAASSAVRTFTRLFAILQTYQQTGAAIVLINLAPGEYGNVSFPPMPLMRGLYLRMIGTDYLNTKFGTLGFYGTNIRIAGLSAARITSTYDALVVTYTGQPVRITGPGGAAGIDASYGGKFGAVSGTTIEFEGSFSYGTNSNGYAGSTIDIQSAIKFIDTPTFTGGLFLSSRSGDTILRNTISYEGNFIGKQWVCVGGGNISCDTVTVLNSIPGTISGGPPNPTGARKAIAGAARAYGVVRNSGTLLQDFGIVSVTKNSTGNFTLVHNCAGPVPIITPGASTVPVNFRVADFGNNQTTFLLTDNDGNPVDSYFSIAIL